MTRALHKPRVCVKKRYFSGSCNVFVTLMLCCLYSYQFGKPKKSEKKSEKKLRLVAGLMLKPVIHDREKTRTLLFSVLNVCHHIWASRQVGILLFYGVTPKDARSRPRSRLPSPFRRPRLDCVVHNGLIAEHKPICKAFRVGQVSLTFGCLELQLSVGAVLAENVATWTSLLIKST